MKWTVTLSTICCLALAGCEATGDVGGTRTFSDAKVPFTFELPTDFTKVAVDRANSRGDVLAGAGITKVDVIAVRRIPPSVTPAGGPQRHEVLGKEVTSEVFAVEGMGDYALECQYTAAHADDVLSACRAALRSVKRK
jgi:hypothetical protein